jgi:hypothetical protein
MSVSGWLFPVRRFTFLGAAAILTVGTANAQLASSPDSSHAANISATDSSSNDYLALTDNPESGSADPTPASGGGAGQYDNRSGGGGNSHGLRSKLAFEAGGGFNGPSGYSSSYITWGGNFTVGAGLNLTKRFTALMEYQFIDDKLPGALIAETGATGGNTHIWSFTVDPVFYLFPKSHNDVYVTGGGGFYRKVTNFTDPQQAQYCTYYYCGIGYQNVTVGHFSSNQGGWNVGAGYAHRMGGIYGDSKMQLFAEVRYLDVMTPEYNSSPNGLGTTFIKSDTKVIPVTFGVRF